VLDRFDVGDKKLVGFSSRNFLQEQIIKKQKAILRFITVLMINYLFF
jgi:hypothetical protein